MDLIAATRAEGGLVLNPPIQKLLQLKSLCVKKPTVRKDLGCKIFDPKIFSGLKIVQNRELSCVKIKMAVETRMKFAG